MRLKSQRGLHKTLMCTTLSCSANSWSKSPRKPSPYLTPSLTAQPCLFIIIHHLGNSPPLQSKTPVLDCSSHKVCIVFHQPQSFVFVPRDATYDFPSARIPLLFRRPHFNILSSIQTDLYLQRFLADKKQRHHAVWARRQQDYPKEVGVTVRDSSILYCDLRTPIRLQRMHRSSAQDIIESITKMN